MAQEFLSDLTMSTIAKSLDACGMRQRVIADNIANVETPGFTRSEVTFEDKLKQALESGTSDDPMDQIEQLQPEVKQDALSPAGPNGNNVSIDKEMTDLTKNALRYETLVQMMNLKAAGIRTAINEGKR